MNLVPNAELFFVEKKKLVRKSTHELFAGKDILIVGLNGAFIPTDEQMVKDYEKLYLKFKDTSLVGDPTDASHIDEIYFVSMNDPYVMEAWWKKMKIKNCKYLADGSGAFSLRVNQQGGMTPNQTVVEMYNKGYGKRSWRYALLLENNCQMCYVEEETPDDANTRDNLEIDPYILTKPEAALEMLKARQQKGHIETLNVASASEDFVPVVDLGQDPNNNRAKSYEKVEDRMGLG
tara:strand:- start:137 stop:838 length:702 start_codon:yes stop_codon:yes gene_type:complete